MYSLLSRGRRKRKAEIHAQSGFQPKRSYTVTYFGPRVRDIGGYRAKQNTDITTAAAALVGGINSHNAKYAVAH